MSCDDIAEEDARKMVEDLFLEAGVDELAGLSAPLCPTDSSAMRAAAKLSEEWKLVDWARRQNADKGVAPCTDHVLQRLADNRLAAGHAFPQERGTVADGAARMWATRFRRRWGGRFGSIAAKEDVSVDEMMSKARVDQTFIRLFRGGFEETCACIRGLVFLLGRGGERGAFGGCIGVGAFFCWGVAGGGGSANGPRLGTKSVPRIGTKTVPRTWNRFRALLFKYKRRAT